ncbi:phage holin family protein [Cellulomonas soli]|uniref:4 TMS phage holin, superfamily IV n=1 Tax=Cellulomonas soli TaxID=931535 RepID=A0A512PHD2_9CELL|nr:phage holin family protein [Cellulomonas soli]NYI60795.1 uncharacterized protein YacL [Cellulomonas soli]GEP70621.1 hypothetical protein CSO01_33360 [Cellulomonas soli]
MIRFLVSAALFLAAAAIGLLVANAVLDDFSVTAASFVWVVVIFALLQAVLAPFFLKTTRKNAPALVGATGLIATYVALIATNVLTDGLSISGLTTWLLAGIIVWLATMLAAFLLPLVFVKKAVDRRQA